MGKRPRYDDDSGDGSVESDEGEQAAGASPPRKLPRSAPVAAISQRKPTPARKEKAKAAPTSCEPSPHAPAEARPAAGKLGINTIQLMF